jgi:hypothetical protein
VGVVGAELGLADGEGALVGVASGVEVPQAAKRDPEVVETAGHVGMVGAKPGLQDRLGALKELPRLPNLGPPPQVGTYLFSRPAVAWRSASSLSACSAAASA